MRIIQFACLIIIVFLLTALMLSCNNADKIVQTTSVKPAAFSVSNLTIWPIDIEYLDVVTISTTVTNTGGSQGSYDIILYINGLEEGTKSVTIVAGSSENVTFYVNRIPSGTYSVAIDELIGSFSVVEPWPFGE